MSSTQFHIDDKLNLSGSGSLREVMKFTGDDSLSSNITTAIKAFKSIDTMYKKAMSNDGQIIGTERSDILYRVDLLFDIMILIWRNIVPPISDDMIHIENKQYKFRMDIIETNGIWKASGSMTPNMTRAAANFQDIYHKKLAPAVIALLNTYKQACEDHVIDDSEKESLVKGVKQVLYYVLFLRLQLEKCLISS